METIRTEKNVKVVKDGDLYVVYAMVQTASGEAEIQRVRGSADEANRLCDELSGRPLTNGYELHTTAANV